MGMDISANGIRDLKDVASRENLPIEGIVADILTTSSMECSLSF
ncbi:hypothetical protein N8146_03250 [Ascidiaceihabitans sp.]|nr:hypothetical protein [Ascidiaceihabitans sp.]